MFKWLMYAVKWMVSVKRKIAMSSNHTHVVDSEEETKSEKKFFHFQHQVDVLSVCCTQEYLLALEVQRYFPGKFLHFFLSRSRFKQMLER